MSLKMSFLGLIVKH